MRATLGISPKVYLPVATQAIAFLVNLIASGSFDRTEAAQIVGLALTAVVGYLASPGAVEEAHVGEGSDSVLSVPVAGKPE